ncbi:UNVERIFIED_ORG: uncharacterized protein (UPF0335 family) [Rhizobium esperanzae]
MSRDEHRPIGRNTISGKLLAEYVEKIERIREEKKQLADDEKAIFAEAQAAGFSPKRIREVLKIRTAKPADLEEAQAELDMYLHAMGMSTDAPLFRAVGMMNVDLAAREQVIEAFKQLVPMDGEIIIKIGKQPVRLWRDAKGIAHAEDVDETPPAPVTPRPAPAPRPARDVPDVDEAGAFDLGEAAYHANEPVTSNPFPWDDKRRAQFDAGWRAASGSDGMGPDT